MGYIPRPPFLNAYTPSDTILVSNDAQKSTFSTSWVKLKEIKLVQPTYGEGRFRFYFELKEVAAISPGAYAQIYKNGVAVGIERVNGTAVWIGFTEDIDLGDWKVGDTVELWVKTYSYLNGAYVQNFRIEGAGSPFINTLGM